ncbi:hypothetical protein RhiirA5_443404 [Rhizophagus irregularis]|uniref:Uncharacterized protein n=1 Tax=Rhizophagus irregularis TaxID=588596 RepID=A0A2N0NDY5_9GLOM|nr:hypothetical protein RhiirA5_443404 [Rhizophagus irregularis]
MLTGKLIPEKKTKLTHTKRLQMHKPCGYCYMIIHMDSLLNYEIISHNLYRGPDALERFVLKIEEELLTIQENLSAPAKMIMASGDLKAYNEVTKPRLFIIKVTVENWPLTNSFYLTFFLNSIG